MYWNPSFYDYIPATLDSFGLIWIRLFPTKGKRPYITDSNICSNIKEKYTIENSTLIKYSQSECLFPSWLVKSKVARYIERNFLLDFNKISCRGSITFPTSFGRHFTCRKIKEIDVLKFLDTINFELWIDGMWQIQDELIKYLQIFCLFNVVTNALEYKFDISCITSGYSSISKYGNLFFNNWRFHVWFLKIKGKFLFEIHVTYLFIDYGKLNRYWQDVKYPELFLLVWNFEME